MVWLYVILLYVLGAVPTYTLFDKTTEHPKYVNICLGVIWPIVSVFYLIYLIINLVKKKTN